MTTLATLAADALQTLQVDLLPILPFYPNTTWNVGKYAVAKIRLTNTTGLPLHSVSIEAWIFGSAAQFEPCNSWDGHSSFVTDLEPGAVHESFYALMKGLSAGPFAMIVTIGAEVIPLASAPARVGTFTVEP